MVTLVTKTNAVLEVPNLKVADVIALCEVLEVRKSNLH